MLYDESQNVIKLLPEHLRPYVEGFTVKYPLIEELRLRTGQRPSIVIARKVVEMNNAPLINQNDISLVIETATRHSLHSSTEELKHGFITASGGYRIGICGSAAIKNGETYSIRDISSINIRIARELQGTADGFIKQLIECNRVVNTLIISPPGLGKTTLLRELIRLISNKGFICGIADERGEIAASFNGSPSFDVGKNTDIQTGMPKSAAVTVLLRTMSPQVIALDEISEAYDTAAVELIANCGTSLIATVHGFDIKDVLSRPVLKNIFDRHIFNALIVISIKDNKREFHIERLGSVC